MRGQRRQNPQPGLFVNRAIEAVSVGLADVRRLRLIGRRLIDRRFRGTFLVGLLAFLAMLRIRSFPLGQQQHDRGQQLADAEHERHYPGRKHVLVTHSIPCSIPWLQANANNPLAKK